MIKKYLISALLFLVGLYIFVESFRYRGVATEEMIIALVFWGVIPVIWLWKRK